MYNISDGQKVYYTRNKEYNELNGNLNKIAKFLENNSPENSPINIYLSSGQNKGRGRLIGVQKKLDGMLNYEGDLSNGIM
jgi:hypothetical protein